MAAPIFKKTKVQQKINLKDEFGVDLSDRPDLIEALGQALIDKMVKRTKESVGMSFSSKGSGRKIDLNKKPYSKAYRQSKEFKAFGKTKRVNMTLSGDMLGQIDILKVKGNEIILGWEDSEENAKAYNHSVGDTVKKRPFFGVNKKELKDLKSEFGGDLKEVIKEEQTKAQKKLTDSLLKTLGALGRGEG